MKNLFHQLKSESKNQTSYVKRFIAYAIDWYVGGALASIPLILLYMSLHEDASYIPQVITIFDDSYQLLAGCLSFSVSLLYYIGIPLYTKGQTLGKKLLGVISGGDHYDEVTVKQIVIRHGLMFLLVVGSIYTASNMLHQMINVVTGFNFASVYAYVGVVISAISVICVFVFQSKKALHDIVAKTIVVDIKSPQYTYEVKKNKKLRKKQLKLS